MEEGAGMPPRRSASLRRQIQTTEDSTGATCRRSTRPHPQIQAIEDGAGLACRLSRGTSPVALQSLPFNDGMLREILIRLPPQPSSLPRASAVCKRWRGLVTDPKFHRQFYAHHRKPPILGVFLQSYQGIKFNPILDRPDRIPPQRFDLRHCSSRDGYSLLDCRHGLLLVKNRSRNEILVCDPITSEQRRVSLPPEFKNGYTNGAVLCADGDLGHIHGGCHLSSYKAVLISTDRSDNQPLGCVYSLNTGVWGNLNSTEAPCEVFYGRTPATLVGNVLYWLFSRDSILAYDLDRENLAVSVGPPVTNDFIYGVCQIIQAEDGAVGFAILAHPRIQMWQRNVNCQGVDTWVPWKTIEMHNIIGMSLRFGEEIRNLLGYDEDNDVLFVHASKNVYAVQLNSMHSRKLYKTDYIDRIHPFTSFYTPGTAINGGSNGAEVLHDT